MRKERHKGYITCYLALMLGVMLSLIFTLFEAVRITTIRTETEAVTEIALFSAFGEFHRELLNQYDLLFIDTSYGEGIPDVHKCEEHVQYYMNENFKEEKLTDWLGFCNLTNIHCDNVEFENYIYASDQQGQVLMHQIAEYMLDKSGIGAVERIFSSFENLGEKDSLFRDLDTEWEEAQERLDGLVEERKKDFIDPETGEEIPIGFENPASQIRQIKAQGTLGLALPKDKQLSSMVITPEYYISRRNIVSGKGELNLPKSILEETAEKAWLVEYLLEKCSTYNRTLEKAVLSYQIEYILHGKDSDLENLEATIEDILKIRQGINFAHLLSDGKKVEEAEAMAAVLSAVFLSPEIKEALKITILFAWNYAESVKDIRILLDGNKLPLWKDDKNWNTPLSQLLSFTSHLGEYAVSEEGMQYQDYLTYFLLLKEKKEILYHFMDICEMDIRVTEGNRYFQMDGCLYGIRAKVNVSSGYGHGYEITRDYIYE